MAQEGERTCPLCAEQMDLTDQQLKPCKCGYEICVWCWHHIMEMAEKDDSEGRCPACRTPYNKEKIVGAAASCDRLMAGVNIEKKVKPNKGKSKMSSEVQKQLSTARVIRRNLVYIVGLPLDLADEDLLQRKDYFGQYGKVLKVSVSRTSSGAIQHFANDTCSVYITYLKEEEALACIQSVHGFVLDGSTLRACYGTSKYCHAWLRNLLCSNPDCVYLHEFGLNEDSFTKDELVSAYTRNRIQQVTGTSNSMQMRFGNALPPPADDYCNRTSTNNLAGSMRISPPNSSCGRSAGGTSWGTQASHNPLTSGRVSSSNGPLKQKLESVNGSVTFSAVLAASSNTMLFPKKENNIKEKPSSQYKNNTIHKLGEERTDAECQIDASDKPVNESKSSKQCGSTVYENGDKFASSSNITNSNPLLSESCGYELVDVKKEILNETINSDVASTSLDRHLVLKEGYVEQYISSIISSTAGKLDSSDGGLHLKASFSEDKDEPISFDEPRPKDTGFVSHVQNNLRNYHTGQLNGGRVNENVEDMQTEHESIDLISSTSGISGSLNGYPEINFSSTGSIKYPRDEETTNTWRFDSENVDNGCNGTLDMGEDSIISNILSLDIDSWDESLTSPQNLAKFLGETDKQKGSSKVSTPWNVHQSNRSRFSFAREEESSDLGSVAAASVAVEQDLGHRSFGHGMNLYNFGTRDGFSLFNGEERDLYSSSHSDFQLNKFPVSRAQVSTPPGFLTPSRAPPPGFAAHERIVQQQSLSSPSGDDQIGVSYLLGNQYKVPQAGNVVNDGDIEFIDPAILAVGKGRFAGGLNSSGFDTRTSPSHRFRAFEKNDATLQLILQRSPHHNQRFDTGPTYSSFSTGSFGYPSNVMDQSFVNNTPQFP